MVGPVWASFSLLFSLPALLALPPKDGTDLGDDHHRPKVRRRRLNLLPQRIARRTDDQTAADICQVVQAPAGDGQRLIPDSLARGDHASVVEASAKPSATVDEREIRLTYRELSALIEDAIRSLR